MQSLLYHSARSAAAPAATPTDIEVPAASPYVLRGDGVLMPAPPFTAPATTTSGFMRPSSVGPRPLQGCNAIALLLMAPTCSVFFALLPALTVNQSMNGRIGLASEASASPAATVPGPSRPTRVRRSSPASTLPLPFMSWYTPWPSTYVESTASNVCRSSRRKSASLG